MRSEARASDLLPNSPEYKPPTLSYETHPNDLKFGYLQTFRGRTLTIYRFFVFNSILPRVDQQ